MHRILPQNTIPMRSAMTVAATALAALSVVVVSGRLGARVDPAVPYGLLGEGRPSVRHRARRLDHGRRGRRLYRLDGRRGAPADRCRPGRAEAARRLGTEAPVFRHARSRPVRAVHGRGRDHGRERNRDRVAQVPSTRPFPRPPRPPVCRPQGARVDRRDRVGDRRRSGANGPGGRTTPPVGRRGP